MNLSNLLFTPHSLFSLSSKMLRATGHARMVILKIMGMVAALLKVFSQVFFVMGTQDKPAYLCLEGLTYVEAYFL